MIDIDFANPLDQVRMNIGDIERDLVSDATITSALVLYNNNVYSTSVAMFQMMCTHFSTLAEKEQVGELQVEHKKRYENYKDRLKDFLAGDSTITPTNKEFLPFIIGGTSRIKKQAIYANEDNFSMYDQAEWHSNRLGGRTLYDMLMEDLDNALYRHYR